MANSDSLKSYIKGEYVILICENGVPDREMTRCIDFDKSEPKVNLYKCLWGILDQNFKPSCWLCEKGFMVNQRHPEEPSGDCLPILEGLDEGCRSTFIPEILPQKFDCYMCNVWFGWARKSNSECVKI